MTRSVVAGIDGSRDSLLAAGWAAREAALRGLPLRLVHAAPVAERDDTEPPAAYTRTQAGEDLLRRAEADLAVQHAGAEVTAQQIADEPAPALLGLADRAELLVLGARGEGGFDGLAVGSTALATADAASCPVVIVPAGRDTPGAVPKSDADIALGVDVRRVAEPPLDFAFEAARLRDARLRVVHAWSLSFAGPWAPLGVPEWDRATWEDEEVQRLSDVLDGRRHMNPEVPVLPDVVLLHPAYALVNASRQAALVVVGRRSGLRTTGRRLGPVAHAVLHHAHCPVAVVPHT